MATEETKTLEGLMRELEDPKVSRITIKREALLHFLFEYACQTLEYDKLNPSDFPEEIEGIMYCKLDSMVETQMAENYTKKGTQKLYIPPMKNISTIIDQERACALNSMKNERSNRKRV